MLETFYCAITVTTAFIGVDMEITNYTKSIASCSVSKTCYYIYYYKNTGFFFVKYQQPLKCRFWWSITIQQLSLRDLH